MSCLSAPQWDNSNVLHTLCYFNWAVDTLVHTRSMIRNPAALRYVPISPFPLPSSIISIQVSCNLFPQVPVFWGWIRYVSASGDAVRLLAGSLATEPGLPALPSMCLLMHSGPPACLSSQRSYVSFPLGRSVDWAAACRTLHEVSLL